MTTRYTKYIVTMRRQEPVADLVFCICTKTKSSPIHALDNIFGNRPDGTHTPLPRIITELGATTLTMAVFKKDGVAA
ncbi:hypothetical protein GWA01_04320 [Gluconobacter wancherniae NBRC 103581]|uniref:Uncharacterized protein n=1 Tax=Gluconobacter wancherniae NBRC 103581 TaxID=656744 RepID=A0A511AYH3_9PROT|nr:hypothetical protein AA103581_1021 [Gluconobacter wancherniae NBRC 103581]GEK92662.1 hypothetical protein GWA01_04320 [Gluconobacter wancherniae NBRC 103581]